MATEFKDILRVVAEELIETGHTEISTIVDEVKRRAPTVIAVERERLINNAIAHEARALMRAWSEGSSEQLALPGLMFPHAIAVRSEGGPVNYISIKRADWQDVQAGKAERLHNIVSAQQRFDQYVASMARLSPWMDTFIAPDGQSAAQTVQEAIERIIAFED